jgi:hypothetical protein
MLPEFLQHCPKPDTWAIQGIDYEFFKASHVDNRILKKLPALPSSSGSGSFLCLMFIIAWRNISYCNLLEMIQFVEYILYCALHWDICADKK